MPSSIPVPSPADRNLPPSRRPAFHRLLPSLSVSTSDQQLPACSHFATAAAARWRVRHCVVHERASELPSPVAHGSSRRLLDHFVGFSLAWLALLFIPSEHRTRGGNWRRTKAAEVTSDFFNKLFFLALVLFVLLVITLPAFVPFLLPALLGTIRVASPAHHLQPRTPSCSCSACQLGDREERRRERSRERGSERWGTQQRPARFCTTGWASRGRATRATTRRRFSSASASPEEAEEEQLGLGCHPPPPGECCRPEKRRCALLLLLLLSTPPCSLSATPPQLSRPAHQVRPARFQLDMDATMYVPSYSLDHGLITGKKTYLEFWIITLQLSLVSVVTFQSNVSSSFACIALLGNRVLASLTNNS